MIRISLVKALLSISVVSLFLFFGFAVTVNGVSRGYEAEIQEVKREHDHAALRADILLDRVRTQRHRADSLSVIVEAQQREEVLWTARALYSETRRPHEMWYVGWVIRNRVEARFRNKRSYKEVILDPKQFSAFNRASPLRGHYMNLDPEDVIMRPRWHDALEVARRVVDAEPELRPFPKNTFHFYSEQSMVGQRHPDWKYAMNHVPINTVEPKRFRFYQNGHSSSSTTTAAR